MNKKDIYWAIQQTTYLGGAEAVSVDLMNELVNKGYNVTLISVAEQKDTFAYNVDKRIAIKSINMPLEAVRFDFFLGIYFAKKQYLKGISLIFKFLFHFFIKRHIYRKRMNAIIGDNKNAIYIGSSLDNYLLSPTRKCPAKIIYHFHFNSDNYFSFLNKVTNPIIRKPDKVVFLAEQTLNEVCAKKKKLRNISTYIYNPIRYPKVENFSYHNNSLIFVGRYVDQKDPMLAVKSAYELHQLGVNFTLNMFGSGRYEKEMNEFISSHHLENKVIINKETKDIKPHFMSSDMLLMTSRYEGFVLVGIEAKAFSLATVATRFNGPSDDVYLPDDSITVETRDPKDIAIAIKTVLDDKNKLLKMKKASYKNYDRYSKDVIIPKWETLLK